MKTVILNSKSGQQDIVTYGKDLFEILKTKSDVVVYEQIDPDFSNIPELTDESEKIVLFNQFALKAGFSAVTQHVQKWKNVKYILSPYSAYEGLDLELLKKLKIHYRNNAGANAKSVAQYAIASMFLLLSKFPVFTKSNDMPDGSVLGEEFAGKTAGIIGMGNVGKEILSTLNALGIPTTYFNRSKEDVVATRVSLTDIFEQDIIFVTIATTPDTISLLSALPSLLREHQYLIDISAADNLYDKKRVVELLNADKLRGYALEIFDHTQLALTSTKNLSATPHIAWCTVDAERRTVKNYLKRAISILEGKSESIDFIV